jgi:serine/threonine protein kinase
VPLIFQGFHRFRSEPVPFFHSPCACSPPLPAVDVRPHFRPCFPTCGERPRRYPELLLAEEGEQLAHQFDGQGFLFDDQRGNSDGDRRWIEEALPNDHLLEVKDVFRDPGSYALVTEFAEGGSLGDLMGGDAGDEQRMALDELTVLTIAEEIIDGLAVLHDNDIVHRDIKPQNILRCDDVWKIADFGISKLMNNPVTGYTFQGAHTAPWAPPEQIQGAAAHPSADIYAWGRVVVFLLTGRTAVDAVAEVPPSWKILLTACTNLMPEQRPDAGSVREQLAKIVG